MKKFWDEFKAFALKGNMMDMAIGVIIGGAFSTLVTSLTDNLISPILGILGKVNFDSMMWDVFGDGQLVFKYGAFITSVINFLIMAFVLFMIVKGMNKLMALGKKEEDAAPAAPAGPTQHSQECGEIRGGAGLAARVWRRGGALAKAQSGGKFPQLRKRLRIGKKLFQPGAQILHGDPSDR